MTCPRLQGREGQTAAQRAVSCGERSAQASAVRHPTMRGRTSTTGPTSSSRCSSCWLGSRHICPEWEVSRKHARQQHRQHAKPVLGPFRPHKRFDLHLCRQSRYICRQRSPASGKLRGTRSALSSRSPPPLRQGTTARQEPPVSALEEKRIAHRVRVPQTSRRRGLISGDLVDKRS